MLLGVKNAGIVLFTKREREEWFSLKLGREGGSVEGE